MAEMEKEGRPPENKRSRKPAHPVKREINEEMKVFLDFGAREPELFLPPAPFGPLYRFGGYRGALVSFCRMPRTPQLLLQVQTEANSRAASPRFAFLRFDGGGGAAGKPHTI